MLLRVRVRGWKNLEDVTVDLPPLLCLSGPNGAGKSNLLEALMLLQKLATSSLREAFLVSRGSISDVTAVMPGRSLELAVTFLVPKQGRDEFGADAHATATLLEYEVRLEKSPDGLQIAAESLRSLASGGEFLSTYGSSSWMQSVLAQSGEPHPLIETREDASTVRLLNDPRPRSGHRAFEASGLKRTVLSGCNQAEPHPTAFLARQTLAGIRFFHLEPALLRGGDSLDSVEFENELSWRGQHLAAVLARLHRTDPNTLVRVSNLLASVIPGIGEVRVHEDKLERNVHFAISIRNREFSATQLSDGTLRVLALATLLEDRMSSGVSVLLEEPENGIHPGQLSAVLDILRGIACDTRLPVDESNPLRQVVFTSHSPQLVSLLAPAEVRFASGGFGAPARFLTVGPGEQSVPMQVVQSFLAGPAFDLHEPSSLSHEVTRFFEAATD